MAAPFGNKNNTKNRPWTEAIRKALLAEDGKRLRAIAARLLTEAESGNVRAMQEMGDRVEGKVPQAITGAEGGPLTIIHEVK